MEISALCILPNTLVLQGWQIAQQKTEAAAREVAQANIKAEAAAKVLAEAQRREALVKQEASEHDQVGDWIISSSVAFKIINLPKLACFMWRCSKHQATHVLCCVRL